MGHVGGGRTAAQNPNGKTGGVKRPNVALSPEGKFSVLSLHPLPPKETRFAIEEKEKKLIFLILTFKTAHVIASRVTWTDLQL